MHRLRALGLFVIALIIAAGLTGHATELADLQPNQQLHGFTVLNLYDNAAGVPMGGRFISDRYGFLIDLLQIESVPQAFLYIKTPPTSSMGEPHACEHLLLGKGNRGRYVAALEDMSLSNSTAFTGQVETCYHFNVIAGIETFYDIFEAKLMAFLHPDFTDEEIRREVCHIGVVEDPQTGKLSLDEKGTVYTEMVSSFEHPWYYYGAETNRLVYGPSHPLSYISGGDPDEMRHMVPEDMWKFIHNTHHLSNMGMILSLPANVPLDQVLTEMDGILSRCQKDEDHTDQVGIDAIALPPAHPAPIGTRKIDEYPTDNPEDPGYINYAWPADLKLDNHQRGLLGLFLQTFSGGQTSNLYNLMFNSQTRVVDLGAGYVYGSFDDDLDVSIYFGVGRIPSSFITPTWIDSIQNIIINELTRVRDLPDNSPELLEFNNRAKGFLEQSRKQTEKYLNDPPMFGYRAGVGAGWMGHLAEIEKEAGFRKSLMQPEQFAWLNEQLSSGINIWREAITQWHIIERSPYSVAAKPSPGLMTALSDAKAQRLAGYVEDFKEKYGVSDDQEAIRRYKEEFDANTAELEALAAKTELPKFTDNPPMTLDPLLVYDSTSLDFGVPFVASTFENMTSSRFQIYFDMNVVPESLMVFLPLLPDLLTGIGVYDGDNVIPYDVMEDRLRQEVLGIGAYFDLGYESGRNELALSAQGSNLTELQNGLDWLDRITFHPFLSVDNLPRIIDVIDQAISGFRNRREGAEEGWVHDPADAYRFQNNPLFLSTNSFLTQAHLAHRLRWMFTDAGSIEDLAQVTNLMSQLKALQSTVSRDSLVTVLTTIETYSDTTGGPLADAIAQAAEQSRQQFMRAARSLKQALADVPDESLDQDFAYLCDEIISDLSMNPTDVIARINALLDCFRKRDNVRTALVSNSADREAILPRINQYLSHLDTAPAVKQVYADRDRIIDRLRGRTGITERPVYAGLVHEGTRNGVLIFSASLAGNFDTSETAIIDALTGKMYSGGGPHSVFMHTWAAGLAYSNGIHYNQTNGRVDYYAERCPDVAETMRFVVNLIENAEDDPGLVDYCVAQVFLRSRAPGQYDSRGLSMASSLADGVGPEVQRAYRTKLLQVAKEENIYAKLKEHMADVYGQVLIGYGPKAAQCNDGVYFLIGPETQFESLEELIDNSEGDQKVYRLYPRDYWITAGAN